MKPFLLYRFGRGDAATQKLFFKWEWAVLCDYKGYQQDWGPSISACPSRANARRIRRTMLRDPHCRNVRIARRLVQTKWLPYNDTYSYNAKGNGNGR